MNNSLFIIIFIIFLLTTRELFIFNASNLFCRICLWFNLRRVTWNVRNMFNRIYGCESFLGKIILSYFKILICIHRHIFYKTMLPITSSVLTNIVYYFTVATVYKIYFILYNFVVFSFLFCCAISTNFDLLRLLLNNLPPSVYLYQRHILLHVFLILILILLTMSNE